MSPVELIRPNKKAEANPLDFLEKILKFGLLIFLVTLEIFLEAVFLLITPFNLWILPEMNHNVRKLSLEISRNRPDIEFNEQLLNTLADKVIYVGNRRSNNSFDNIVIFDKAKMTLWWKRGYLYAKNKNEETNPIEPNEHE